MQKQEQLKDITKQITVLSLINTPGQIALGLGLYGYFAANGDAFHPLLNDENVVMGLLVFGIASSAITAIKSLSLFRKKKQLEKELGITH